MSEGLYLFHGREFTVTKYGVLINDKGKRIKPTVCKKGYHRVVLQAKGNRFTTGVHRLVAICYLKRTWKEINSGKLQVNHIDGNKGNNHISNLEWCTGEENIKHAIDNGLITSPKGFAAHRTKLTPDLLAEIHGMLESGMKQKNISVKVGISQPVISQIKRKVRDWY